MAEAGKKPTQVNSDELEHFREEWRLDIASHQKQHTTTHAATARPALTEKEKKAIRYYVEATHYEATGRLDDAVKLYRQAFSLCSDVDRKYWATSHQDQNAGKKQTKDSILDEDAVAALNAHRLEHLEGPSTSGEAKKRPETNEIEGLVALFSNTSLSVQPEKDPHGALHLSDLPQEVLHKILRHVTLPSLDLRSIEAVAGTCRALYVQSRDSRLWKDSCRRVWGHHAQQPAEGQTWRQMYIEKPRLRFDGIYVSKESYVRAGERGLDHYYAPCHIVEHYRYLRFYGDGTLRACTTPLDPLAFIPAFKQGTAQGTMFGRYVLVGNTVVCRLARVVHEQPGQRRGRRQREGGERNSQQMFVVTLALTNAKGKRNVRLQWISYKCTTTQPDGSTVSSEFDTSQHFTPYHFVRVKNFHAASSH